MTDDQAQVLRRLVRRRAAADASAAGPRPRTVLITGGKGGVGTTTMAVNLAAACARAGQRNVCLIDADPQGGDVALLCGLEERHTLADVLAGRQRVSAALQAGPGGLRVLCGDYGRETRSERPPAACESLLTQLHGPATRADLVIVDAGNRPSGIGRALWRTADVILVATAPETASVLATYAAIRLSAVEEPVATVYSLVNMAPDARAGEAVHARLAEACRRFLALELRPAGSVPLDPAVACAGRAGKPLVIASPDSNASRLLHRLAATLPLGGHCGTRRRGVFQAGPHGQLQRSA